MGQIPILVRSFPTDPIYHSQQLNYAVNNSILSVGNATLYAQRTRNLCHQPLLYLYVISIAKKIIKLFD